MISTIISSFFFIYPIYLSYLVRDTLGLFMFTIAMGVSIANHSHTFGRNAYRRNLFSTIDVSYIRILTTYVIVESFLYHNFTVKLFIIILSLMNLIIFRQLGSRRIEYYTEYQKKLHFMFHLIGISSMTFARYYRYFI